MHPNYEVTVLVNDVEQIHNVVTLLQLFGYSRPRAVSRNDEVNIICETERKKDEDIEAALKALSASVIEHRQTGPQTRGA